MTIINFDEIIGKKFNTITNNFFCLSHPKNALIIGRTNSGRSNILMNLIAQNSIYEKNIYTNNLDDKYKWLKSKFNNDVFIFINEINFDIINNKYVNDRRLQKGCFKTTFCVISKSQFTAILRVLCQNCIDLVIRNEL